MLPQILLFGDFIIEKTALAMNISRPQKEVVGRVRVTGHVKVMYRERLMQMFPVYSRDR